MTSQFEWSKIQPPETIESSRKYIFNDDLLPSLIKYIGVKKGDKLVDLGCGTGTFTRYLAKGLGKECEVIGVDSDRQYIEYAQKKVVEEDLVDCIDFIESDVYNLPFEDETIDSITDHTLLINLDNPDRFIKEELRVLKKGGSISTSTFLFNYYPPSRAINNPEFDQLLKIQQKVYKFYKDHIFPRSFLEGNELNIYLMMKRYKNLNIQDIQINGFFPLFSPDDYRNKDIRRQWLKEQLAVHSNDIQVILSNQEYLAICGIEENELNLALKLLEERYHYELDNTTYIFTNSMEVIISGKKAN